MVPASVSKQLVMSLVLFSVFMFGGCTADLKVPELPELPSLPNLSLKRETPAPLIIAPLRETRVAIPASGRITVQPNDTVYGLAARYRVTPQSIITDNDLKSPYQLEIGQELLLVPPLTHAVTSGDTIYSLSQRYAVSQYQIATLNELSEPYELTNGQVLTLPDTQDFTVLDGVSVENTPRDNQVSTPRQTATPTASAPRKPAKRIVAPSLNGAGFTWPLSGEIITEFGPVAKGVHNDGVNIAAAAGSPVTVSAPGTVAYIGRDLKTFGTLVLVKHEGGLITAYAHLDGLSVTEGQVLDAGALVGQVGMTGRVTSPQLHFEIRKSRTPVNPRDLIS